MIIIFMMITQDYKYTSFFPLAKINEPLGIVFWGAKTSNHYALKNCLFVTLW